VSVVVASLQTALPGQDEALVAAVTRAFRTPTDSASACQSAHFFQDIRDQTRFLYLAEWESKAAFQAYVREVGASFFADGSDFFYCLPLASIGPVQRPVQAVGCSITQTKWSMTSGVAKVMLDEWCRIKETSDDLLHYSIYRDEDDPGRFISVHYWSSNAELEQFRAKDAPIFTDRLAEQDAAVIQFRGRTRVHLSTSPLEPRAANLSGGAHS
jgi:quinol monooxygenase YgiN